MSEFIQEFTEPALGRLKIDKSRGILHGVKILGTLSRNRRRYPVEVLKKAIPLYENAKVNLDHPDGDPNRPRSYTDRLGVIREVRLHGDDGLYADFHFNPNHPLAEQLLWDAEHAPSNVGFSHNVEAVLRRDQSETIVEDILSVRSVDLVADPATTTGLFESVEPEETQSTFEKQVETLTVKLVASQGENELLCRKMNALKLLLELVFSGVTEDECRYVSFFRSPFLETVYRCLDEEEMRRLVADRLDLVRRIAEQEHDKHFMPSSLARSPFESEFGTKTDRQSFLEAITG